LTLIARLSSALGMQTLETFETGAFLATEAELETASLCNKNKHHVDEDAHKPLRD